MAVYYDVAQICLNGHVTNVCARQSPQDNQKFCELCGGQTIVACPSCKTNIRGYYHIQGICAPLMYDRLRHCPSCGKAYPWTERETNAVVELMVEELSSDKDDAQKIEQTIKALTTNTPQTPVAVARFKEWLPRLAGASGKMVQEMITRLATEAAIRQIWGPK